MTAPRQADLFSGAGTLEEAASLHLFQAPCALKRAEALRHRVVQFGPSALAEVEVL